MPKQNKWYVDKVIKKVRRTNRHNLLLAAEFCAGNAQLIVPVDKGNLKASIFAEVVSKNTSRYGATADYAAHVEFGTGEHAENGLGKQGFVGMPAQPFIRPAYMEFKPAIRKILNMGT